MRTPHIILAAVLTATSLISCGQSAPTDPNAPLKVPVTITGGHDLDPRDGGRPVILIAAALGVPAEVFREAFTRVHPAPGGTHPDPEQVHENKRVLMEALAPYGVTNDRLDEVSNYYRYNRARGEMWPTNEASAYAIVKKGKITSFIVTGGGSGYSSPPTISIPGRTESATPQLAWDQDFEANGSISLIAPTPTTTN